MHTVVHNLHTVVGNHAHCSSQLAQECDAKRVRDFKLSVNVLFSGRLKSEMEELSCIYKPDFLNNILIIF